MQGPLCLTMITIDTVKVVLRDHCHDGPSVLKDHIFLSEGAVFLCC